MITICNYEQSLKNLKSLHHIFFCNLFLYITFFSSSTAHLNFKWIVAIIGTGDAAFSRYAEQLVLRTVYTE